MESVAAKSGWIRDVGDTEFEREVLEASRTTPVVVDFWAPWCGPCRTLGPVLERLTQEHAGAFRLAKVNVDESPQAARRYAVRAIPAVLGLRGGEIAARFEGAQPERAVREFLRALLPSEADRLVQEGGELAAAGHANAAEDRHREALAREPRHEGAALGLAQLLAERGAVDEALALLEPIAAGGRRAAEAKRLAAALRTRVEGSGDLGELLRKLEVLPDDLEARLALGRALAAQVRHEEGLGELLRVVQRDPRFGDEAARKTMLDLFAILGPEHPLTGRFRRELARALYR
jgi:putative thioredoxin